jgi:hypothetical protein
MCADRMLTHYSHIRLDAMRKALDGLAGGTLGGSPVTNAVTKSEETDAPRPEVFLIFDH